VVEVGIVVLPFTYTRPCTVTTGWALAELPCCSHVSRGKTTPKTGMILSRIFLSLVRFGAIIFPIQGMGVDQVERGGCGWLEDKAFVV